MDKLYTSTTQETGIMAPISGRVIEVGWEPTKSRGKLIYALVKVKVATTKRQDRADKQLQTLRKRVLGKKVAVFPES